MCEQLRTPRTWSAAQWGVFCACCEHLCAPFLGLFLHLSASLSAASKLAFWVPGRAGRSIAHVSSSCVTSSLAVQAMKLERARAFVWARMSLVASACATLACSVCRFYGPCGLPVSRGLSPQVGARAARLGCSEPGVACTICGASHCGRQRSTMVSLSPSLMPLYDG